MTEEMIQDQRTCFAIKACHMMGKSIDEAAKLLVLDSEQVRMIYELIDKDRIDFDSI